MAKEGWKLEQEETPCPPPEAPSLCSNNCGFFGSSATMNLCSACYRDLVLLKPKSPSSSPAKDLSPPTSPLAISGPACSPLNPSASIPAHPSVEGPSAAATSSPPLPQQPSATRCFSCRKRVGLTGFKCRCGDVFCSLHRYSDKHECSFDYKAAGRAAISKANPVVKAVKVERI